MINPTYWRLNRRLCILLVDHQVTDVFYGKILGSSVSHNKHIRHHSTGHYFIVLPEGDILSVLWIQPFLPLPLTHCLCLEDPERSCLLGPVADPCQCCRLGVCGLAEGEPCYNSTVHRNISEIHHLGVCASNLICEVRLDIDHSVSLYFVQCSHYLLECYHWQLKENFSN